MSLSRRKLVLMHKSPKAYSRRRLLRLFERESFRRGRLKQMICLSEKIADLEDEVQNLVELFIEQEWDKR